MNRITNKNGDKFTVSEAEFDAAVQALGRFEDAYEDLMKNQAEIPALLEKLRAEGREKSITYKEAVAQKLINNNIIMFFEKHGIKTL